MKLGAENKKEMRLMAVLLIIAVPAFVCTVRTLGVWGRFSTAPVTAPTSGQTTGEQKSAVLQAHGSDPDVTLRLERLQTAGRILYQGGTRNIFRMEERQIHITHDPVQPGSQPPTVAEMTPPISLKFYGFSCRMGEPKRVFLNEGDDIFVAIEGEVINRKYKIAQVTNNLVLVEDLLNNNRQTIPITASCMG